MLGTMYLSLSNVPSYLKMERQIANDARIFVKSRTKPESEDSFPEDMSTTFKTDRADPGMSLPVWN